MNVFEDHVEQCYSFTDPHYHGMAKIGITRYTFNVVSFFNKPGITLNCPRKVLAQRDKARGGTLEVLAYRQDYFVLAEKLSIFVNTARKGLPKLCWRSDKHTNSFRNRGDPDSDQIKSDFNLEILKMDFGIKKNNSEGIVSNSEVPVNLDIQGECRFASVKL